MLCLTLTQYPYDPGTLPGSANQCILGNVSVKDMTDDQHILLQGETELIHTLYKRGPGDEEAA